MPIRNIKLTDELDRFASGKVNSGSYEDASEITSAILRTLEHGEQVQAAKLAALRAAVDEGDASGIADPGVFARVRRILRSSLRRSSSAWRAFSFHGRPKRTYLTSASTL